MNFWAGSYCLPVCFALIMFDLCCWTTFALWFSVIRVIIGFVGRVGRPRRDVTIVILLWVDVHALSALPRSSSLLLVGHAPYPRVHILAVVHLEGLRFGASVLCSGHGDACVLHRQLLVLYQALLECLETMRDELL